MRKASFILVGIIILVGIAFFVAFGPPKLLARTETPAYCASCHVMEEQYQAWLHQGSHRQQACVSCHLPHDNVVKYYIWKGIDGMKDLIVFHSGMVPERIEISDHGRDFVQQNCIRCHSTTVEKMMDTTRNCWDCHRDLQHRLTGTIATMEVSSAETDQ